MWDEQWALYVALVVKKKKNKKTNPPANVGDTRDEGLIPELGRSPGEGNSNTLQYSCLENSMGRGAWLATITWGHKEQDMTQQLSMHILRQRP